MTRDAVSISGLFLDQALPEVLDLARSTGYSRFPVIGDSSDDIRGVVHVKKVVAVPRERRADLEAGALMTEVIRVPETVHLDQLLAELRDANLQMAVVVDEYGDVRGVVTLEDILEEIVGEFSNQDTLRSPDIHPQEDGTLVIDGAAYIREVNRALDWHLPCDGPKTLNGLITEALEHIPDSGICLQIGNYRLEILQAADNRVKSVRAWTVSATPSAEQQVG